ncbi:hypothetical protein VP01_2892g4 [Puccinia sorghi]|uniref:SNF2 N-terminal domain-containing protein n=1 Tax=Puccinia sorghi TaxID=27349 RepID=A0A0L6V1K2_9BASI|nr:hypothetical protein VP01_2892g4 [Puccinia sorghi]
MFDQKIVKAFKEAQIILTLICNYYPNIHQWKEFLFLIPGPMLDDSKTPSMPSTSIPPQQQLSIQTTISCMASGCTTTTIGYKKLATSPYLDPEDSQTALCPGSILADNLGWGKTLTTLIFVLVKSHLARDFQWSDLDQGLSHRSAFFIYGSADHLKNDWTKWKPTTYQPIQNRELIVMITQYHMEPQCQKTSSCPENPCSTHVVCLSGTFQNWLKDVQSLISLLKIWPLWK